MYFHIDLSSDGEDSNSSDNVDVLEEQEPEDDQVQEPESHAVLDLVEEDDDEGFYELNHRPASRRVVENLPTIMVTEEVLNLMSNEICTVCQQGFMIGQELSQLPCNHMYHKDCILTWLGHRNTCPLCTGEPRNTQEAPQGNVGNDGRRERRWQRIMMVIVIVVVMTIMIIMMIWFGARKPDWVNPFTSFLLFGSYKILKLGIFANFV